MPDGSYTTEGEVDFDGFHTWYGVIGHLDPSEILVGRAPLVVLHGGPGDTHDYLLPIADLTESGRTVVFYDQLGNGRSSHLPGRGADFWTVELFVRELANLIRHLGIGARHHILGHSWGGFLAQEYAATRPVGLQSLVLSDTGASYPDFIAGVQKLRALLPADVGATLRRHEDAHTTDDQEYADACAVFASRHLCRLPKPWPDEILTSFAASKADNTVSRITNGPMLHVTGSFKDLETFDRLARIDVPTLVISGAHDQAIPELQGPLMSGIANSEQVLLPDSSHMPMWEEPAAYMNAVRSFLDRHD